MLLRIYVLNSLTLSITSNEFLIPTFCTAPLKVVSLSQTLAYRQIFGLFSFLPGHHPIPPVFHPIL